MADSPPPIQDSEPPPELVSEAVLEETLKHAKAGYDNAQNVIKLIDAKAGVLIGLSTFGAGFLATVFKWYIELDPVSSGGAKLLAAVASHPYHSYFALLAAKSSLLAGLVCIGACVWSVIARSRPMRLREPFLVLFPYYTRSQEELAKAFFSRRLQGMSRADILVEYEDQLRVLGLILSKKLKHNRIASIAFLTQLILLATTLFVLLNLYSF